MRPLRLASLLPFALLLAAPPPAAAVELRDVVGVAHAAGRYSFTEEDYLNEGADQVLALGSRVLKVFLVPEQVEKHYPFHSDWTPWPADVVELARHPYFRKLFAKPFSTFLLVVTPVEGRVRFLDGMSPEEVAVERDQLQRLAAYLLSTYAGTGKTFVLQNWEGDHLLYDGLAPGEAPNAVRVRGMIDWWRARQEGVRRARAECGTEGVEVYHAAEVNDLGRAMKGEVTAANDVVPWIDADLYSYSSWDVGFEPAALRRALDHLEAKAPPSERFGERNLYLGEFGMATDHGLPEDLRPERIRRLLETALAWGVRYAVYWEVYCNESQTDYGGRPRNVDLRGFWLVRPDGTRARMWDDLAAQLPAALHAVTLRSALGPYLSAGPIVPSPPPGGPTGPGEGGEPAGGLEIRADRWVASDPWEGFALKDENGGELRAGDAVTLQAHDGAYLGLAAGGGGRIVTPAGADDSGGSLPAAARFVLRRLDDGEGAILPGDPFALQAPSGLYLGAEPAGFEPLRARRSTPGPAETFTYLPR